MSNNATENDTDILYRALGVTAAASEYLKRISTDFEEDTIAEVVAELAETIQIESELLEEIISEGLQVQLEEEARRSGDSEAIAPEHQFVNLNGPISFAEADAFYAVYDQRAAKSRGKQKWYRPNRRSSKKRGICFHHTAVSGGYGTRSGRRNYWRSQAVSASPAVVQHDGTSVATSWIGASWPGEVSEEDTERWIRAMALADRFRGYKAAKGNGGVPYHVVAAMNGVLYLNLPFDWWTWHGNGSNQEFLGFAWDASSNKDTFNCDHMLAQIKRVIEIGRSEGHFQDGLEFTGHCCWTNKPRDPGKEFVEFLLDIKDELGATVNLDFKQRSKHRSFREILAG